MRMRMRWEYCTLENRAVGVRIERVVSLSCLIVRQAVLRLPKARRESLDELDVQAGHEAAVDGHVVLAGRRPERRREPVDAGLRDVLQRAQHSAGRREDGVRRAQVPLAARRHVRVERCAPLQQPDRLEAAPAGALHREAALSERLIEHFLYGA